MVKTATTFFVEAWCLEGVHYALAGHAYQVNLQSGCGGSRWKVVVLLLLLLHTSHHDHIYYERGIYIKYLGLPFHTAPTIMDWMCGRITIRARNLQRWSLGWFLVLGTELIRGRPNKNPRSFTHSFGSHNNTTHLTWSPEQASWARVAGSGSISHGIIYLLIYVETLKRYAQRQRSHLNKDGGRGGAML